MTDLDPGAPAPDAPDAPESEATEAPTAPEARGRGRTVLYVSIAVLVLMGGFVALLATRKPASEQTVQSALINKAVPDVSGPTIDGGRFSIDSLSGKWILVNFFATWCAPCQQEHPEIKSWAAEHAAAGDAAVVAVVYGDDPNRVRSFFKTQGGNWPVVIDNSTDSPISLRFGVTAPPESYLVRPDGTVVYKIVGGVHQKFLDDLLAKAKAATGLKGGS